jgi:hypothetical protein
MFDIDPLNFKDNILEEINNQALDNAEKYTKSVENYNYADDSMLKVIA